MREWWANVYPGRYGQEPYTRLGEKGVSRGEAEQARALGRPAFRIHVRLKPEGAPRRYASAANRRAWEIDPDECRARMASHAFTSEQLRYGD